MLLLEYSKCCSKNRSIFAGVQASAATRRRKGNGGVGGTTSPKKILKKVFFQGWKNYTPVQFSIKKRAFKAATWLADTMTVVMAEVVVDMVEGKQHSFNQATPQNAFLVVLFSMCFLHDLFQVTFYFSWNQMILKCTSAFSLEMFVLCLFVQFREFSINNISSLRKYDCRIM